MDLLVDLVLSEIWRGSSAAAVRSSSPTTARHPLERAHARKNRKATRLGELARPLDPLEDAYAHGEAGFVRRPAPDRPRDAAARAFSRWPACRRGEWTRGSQDWTRTAVLRRRTTDQRCSRGALQDEGTRSRRHWHRVWRHRRSVRSTAWARQARQMLLRFQRLPLPCDGGSRRCLEPSVNIDADGPVGHRNQLLGYARDQGDR